MMRFIKILVFFLIPIVAEAETSDLIKIRDLYYKASTNKKDSEVFSEEMRTVSGIGKSLTAGYTGMSYMIKANHAFNPYYKLSYFIKGKDLLDNAITSDPANVELRFLRFCVQTNAPGFLGYSGKIDDDKKVILSGFATLKDEDLEKRIKEYMLASKNCSKEEKAVFQSKRENAKNKKLVSVN